eukprot:scaffold5578_cov110-Isochrysis_galbana.AAC.3
MMQVLQSTCAPRSSYNPSDSIRLVHAHPPLLAQSLRFHPTCARAPSAPRLIPPIPSDLRTCAIRSSPDPSDSIRLVHTHPPLLARSIRFHPTCVRAPSAHLPILSDLCMRTLRSSYNPSDSIRLVRAHPPLISRSLRVARWRVGWAGVLGAFTPWRADVLGRGALTCWVRSLRGALRADALGAFTPWRADVFWVRSLRGALRADALGAFTPWRAAR